MAGNPGAAVAVNPGAAALPPGGDGAVGRATSAVGRPAPPEPPGPRASSGTSSSCPLSGEDHIFPWSWGWAAGLARESAAPAPAKSAKSSSLHSLESVCAAAGSDPANAPHPAEHMERDNLPTPAASLGRAWGGRAWGGRARAACHVLRATCCVRASLTEIGQQLLAGNSEQTVRQFERQDSDAIRRM